MNIEDDDCDSLDGSPHPAWGYYVLWHRIQHIKARLDMTLIAMVTEEHVSFAANKTIKKLLIEPSKKLIEIIDEFPPDGDEIA